MRITQEGDYALRVVLYLCKQDDGAQVKAKVIAEQEGIPLRFLLKLLRKLILAGIVKSFRGTDGGYAIAKPPGEITFKKVIEAIEGPIYVNRCLYDSDFCNLKRTDTCHIHHALCKIQARLLDDLNNITIQDVMNKTF